MLGINKIFFCKINGIIIGQKTKRIPNSTWIIYAINPHLFINKLIFVIGQKYTKCIISNKFIACLLAKTNNLNKFFD